MVAMSHLIGHIAINKIQINGIHTISSLHHCILRIFWIGMSSAVFSMTQMKAVVEILKNHKRYDVIRHYATMYYATLNHAILCYTILYYTVCTIAFSTFF